jgi:hypothetical protein
MEKHVFLRAKTQTEPSNFCCCRRRMAIQEFIRYWLVPIIAIICEPYLNERKHAAVIAAVARAGRARAAVEHWKEENRQSARKMGVTQPRMNIH